MPNGGVLDSSAKTPHPRGPPCLVGVWWCSLPRERDLLKADLYRLGGRPNGWPHSGQWRGPKSQMTCRFAHSCRFEASDSMAARAAPRARKAVANAYGRDKTTTFALLAISFSKAIDPIAKMRRTKSINATTAAAKYRLRAPDTVVQMFRSQMSSLRSKATVSTAVVQDVGILRINANRSISGRIFSQPRIEKLLMISNAPTAPGSMLATPNGDSSTSGICFQDILSKNLPTFGYIDRCIKSSEHLPLAVADGKAA